MSRKTQIPLKVGQIWAPKRGTYSLRILKLHVGSDGQSVKVQKFSPSGVYAAPVLKAYDVDMSERSIRKDYKLPEGK